MTANEDSNTVHGNESSATLDQSLIMSLRCPQTGQNLRMMTADELLSINGALIRNNLKSKNNEPPQSKPFSEGLATHDGRWAYPIEDGIAVLLSERALPVALNETEATDS